MPMFLLFRDFILKVGERVNNCYPVWLVDSPWGEAEIMVSEEEFAKLQGLNNALETAYVHRDERAIRVLGRRLGIGLFDTLIREGIRRRYDKSLGSAHQEEAILRILLRVTPHEWADLLLESMYDCDPPHLGDQFLCRGRKTVLSRYPIKAQPDNEPVQYREFRVLVVVSSPLDKPLLIGPSEGDRLRQTIRERAELPLRFLRLSPSVKIEFLRCATYSNLETKMRSFHPHAVHFIGHAECAGENPGLVLEDDEGCSDVASGERLLRLFRGPEEILS